MLNNKCKICSALANSTFTYPDNSQQLTLCGDHFNNIYQYYVSLAKQVNSNAMTLTQLIEQLHAYLEGLQ